MQRRKFLRNLAAGLLATSVVAAGIAGPLPTASAAPEPILSVDFNDESIEPLLANGSPTLDFVEGGVSGLVLSISDRADGYFSVQTVEGVFEPQTTYTLSAQVRLPEGAEGTHTAHFTVADGDYTWVGNTTVSADEWSPVTGEYTLLDSADPATTKAYLEVEPATENGPQPDFLLDDVVIVEVAPEDVDDPDGQAPGAELIAADFEDGLQGWVPRATASGQGDLDITTDHAHGGEQSAILTNRTSQGDGIGYDVTGILVPGTTYELSAWLRFAPGQETDSITLSMARTNAGEATYVTFA